jgi:hypothetical protein
VSLETAIKFFRRQRTAQFRATGRVTRVTAPGAFNPSTGAIGDPTVETIYEGRCNVREVTWEGTDVRTGEREVRLQRAELQFPHDTAILEDDVVTVTSATHDTDLVGREYRITDVFLDAWQTTRRAIGEKVTRGPEES